MPARALLADLLAQAQLNQAELGRALNIDQAQISRWMSPYHPVTPQPSTCVLLADFFKVDRREFLQAAGYLPEKYLNDAGNLRTTPPLAKPAPKIQSDPQLERMVNTYRDGLLALPRSQWPDIQHFTVSLWHLLARCQEDAGVTPGEALTRGTRPLGRLRPEAATLPERELSPV